MLKFLNGSNFDRIIETKSNLNEANRNGTFYKSGNDRVLTKNAYMHENSHIGHLFAGLQEVNLILF